MITRIEALNFRCLRYISRTLDPFHVLVGPNASGKTTFFDVVGFVSRLLNGGLEGAIGAVTPDPLDLLFGRAGERFELAIEAAVPQTFQQLGNPTSPVIRYELVVDIGERRFPQIEYERLFFPNPTKQRSPRTLFPEEIAPDSSVCHQSGKSVIGVVSGKYALARGESEDLLQFTQRSPLRIDSQESALSRYPLDESVFPISSWFNQLISGGIQNLSLDSHKMRRPSPPLHAKGFRMDGSNLPWVISKLEGTPALTAWIDHLRTSLPDLAGIRTVVREEDRHCYLKIRYQNGLELPSWMVSDGTLRLLALTLPAFMDDMNGMLLIEEPENGVHPRAIETVFQALSNVSSAQVLMATHSPIILNIVEPSQVLCFAKDDSGATDIVRGDEHPALIDWQHDVSLGTLFAAGVLG